MNASNSFAFLSLIVFYCVCSLLLSSSANATFVTLFDNSNNNKNFTIHSTNRTNEIKNPTTNKTGFLEATSNLFQSFYEKLIKTKRENKLRPVRLNSHISKREEVNLKLNNNYKNDNPNDKNSKITLFEENELERQLEEEIIRNSIALGLNPFFSNNNKNDSILLSLSTSSEASFLSATTTSSTSTTIKNKTEKQSEDDPVTVSSDDPEDNSKEAENASENVNKIKKASKTSNSKTKKKSGKKQNKDKDEESDEESKNDTTDTKVSSSKLSKKQLQQIYKFIKSKEKSNTKKEDNNDLQNEYLISTLLMSPKHEIHSKLRDSLAAKAANKALLKWHSKMPLASLHELETIYNKFYEYYYNHLESSTLEKEIEDEDEALYNHHGLLANPLDHEFNHHDSLSHHSTHSLKHNHFNLLDFINTKMNEKDDENEEDIFGLELDDKRKKQKKSSSKGLFKKLIESFNFYEDPHHHEYPLDEVRSHHVHGWNHNHHSYSNMHSFNDYFHELKKKLNYYYIHNMQPPISLIDEYQRQTRLYQDMLMEQQRNHETRYHSLIDHHSLEAENPFSSNHLYEELPHHDSHFDEFHHQLQHEFCNNYPDHSSEGFKSFISVESCMQPSYLSSNGIPVFGNGCTFRYICEFGYLPIGGVNTAIKCINGYWSERALCIKQDINSHGLNTFNNNQNLMTSQQTNSNSNQSNNGAGQSSSLVSSNLSSGQNSKIQSPAQQSFIKRHVRSEKSEDRIAEQNQIENSKPPYYNKLVDIQKSIKKDKMIQEKEFDMNGEMNKSNETSDEAQYDDESNNSNNSDEITVTEITSPISEKNENNDKAFTSTTPANESYSNKINSNFTNSNVTTQKNDLFDTPENSLNDDPTLDWSALINNDSEKTIYESFYELLDNELGNDSKLDDSSSSSSILSKFKHKKSKF